MIRARCIFALRMLASLALAACGSSIQSLSTTTGPGEPVITYPNSFDARWSTVISSEPFATQAGIDGRTLTIAVFHGAQRIQNDLTLDYDGNLGVRGVFKSVSTRKAKYDIRTFPGGALQMLRALPMKTFRYRGEAGSESAHLGFLAEEAPELLAGARHDSFNLNNSVGVTMAATKELDARIEQLVRRVSELELTVACLRSRRERVSCSSTRR